ncbi:MAG: YhbY family RNA-binding protein [Nanoarchaeota archaeon]
MTTIKPSTVFQIGKNGVTEASIEALNSRLKTFSQVRVSILRSTGRDSKTMKSLAEEISSKLKIPTYSRVIGFTIVLSRKGKYSD